MKKLRPAAFPATRDIDGATPPRPRDTRLDNREARAWISRATSNLDGAPLGRPGESRRAGEQLLWLGWCLLAACGGETAGQRVLLHWNIGSAEQAERNTAFTTDTGWDVTLEEAHVAVGPIYALAPAPTQLDAVASVARELVLPVAHAHDGYDAATGRRVRAELLEVITFDALDPEVRDLGAFEADAGEVATLKIEIARLTNALPESLHGRQAYVRGHAQRDDRDIPFEGRLVELRADDDTARRVETDSDFLLEAGGTLDVSVDARAWLRLAEFDQLTASGDDDVAHITEDSQVGRAWKVGVREPSAFSVTWQAAEP